VTAHRLLQVAVMAFGAFSFQSGLAAADELYSFYTVNCLPEMRSLTIDKFRLWNVGDFVWPWSDDPLGVDAATRRRHQWELHVEHLRQLEERHSVYVIRQAYRYWDEHSVDCPVGKMTFRITFEQARLDDGGDVRLYRGPATLAVVDSAGQPRWQMPLDFEHASFTINRGVVAIICRDGQVCDGTNFQVFDLKP